MEYVIPLRDAYRGPRTKRAKRAMRIIREFVSRHRKVDPSRVRIGNDVNEYVWTRGIQKPPRKVRVVVEEKDGLVWVRLGENTQGEA